MSITSKDDMATCMYCGEQISNTTESILKHITVCEKRPELQLIMKINILEGTGDVLLETIHSVVKALAEIEGMRSKSWEIYHLAKEKWEEVKQLTPEEMLETVQEELEKIENEQKGKEEKTS